MKNTKQKLSKFLTLFPLVLLLVGVMNSHAMGQDSIQAKKVVLALPMLDWDSMGSDLSVESFSVAVNGHTFPYYRFHVNLTDIAFGGMKDQGEVYYDYEIVRNGRTYSALKINLFAFTAQNRGMTFANLTSKFEFEARRIDEDFGLEILIKNNDGEYKSFGFLKPNQ